MNPQFKKGVLELLVLSLLVDKDCYGYQLVDTISNHVEISEGTIYPLLRRLKKEGLVTTYLKESMSGPPRKYYQLTEEGQMEFEDQKRTWFAFSRAVDEILRREE